MTHTQLAEQRDKMMEETFSNICDEVMKVEDAITITREVVKHLGEHADKKITKRVIKSLEEQYPDRVTWSGEKDYPRFTVWYRGSRYDFRLYYNPDRSTLDFDAFQMNCYLPSYIQRLETLKLYKESPALRREMFDAIEKYLEARQVFGAVQHENYEFFHILPQQLRSLRQRVDV